MNIQLKSIRDEITSLILAHPELEDDEVLRADSIEGETTAFEFLSELIRKIGSTDALLNGTLNYAKELQERVERLEHRKQVLRSIIHKVMNTANLSRVELAEATLFVRNNPPKVVIVNEAEIPEDFLRIKKEPDKTRIKAAILAHENVPGACLSNQEPSLTIRVA